MQNYLPNIGKTELINELAKKNLKSRFLNKINHKKKCEKIRMIQACLNKYANCYYTF